jgi:hypothetical protein
MSVLAPKATLLMPLVLKKRFKREIEPMNDISEARFSLKQTAAAS